MGVLKTKYAYKALSMDHFFLKGVEYLAIADRHSGMISVHATHHKGAKELLKILRLHCQRNGTLRCVIQVEVQSSAPTRLRNFLRYMTLSILCQVSEILMGISGVNSVSKF